MRETFKEVKFLAKILEDELRAKKEKISIKDCGDLATKVTSALQLAKQQGVSVSEATHIQNNYWTIPPNYKPLFPTYFILSWDIDYFRERLQEGTVRRENVTYQVIYHRTNPAEISKGHGQVKLSFRAFDRDFKIQPVVLVSLSHKFNHSSHRVPTKKT